MDPVGIAGVRLISQPDWYFHSLSLGPLPSSSLSWWPLDLSASGSDDPLLFIIPWPELATISSSGYYCYYYSRDWPTAYLRKDLRGKKTKGCDLRFSRVTWDTKWPVVPLSRRRLLNESCTLQLSRRLRKSTLHLGHPPSTRSDIHPKSRPNAPGFTLYSVKLQNPESVAQAPRHYY